MEDWFQFIQLDLLSAFSDLTFSDFMVPCGILLWLGILALPLHGMDRRDIVSGLSYTLFCSGNAVLLFLALPGYLSDWKEFSFHFALILSCSAIAAYRWFHTNSSLIIISSEKQTKKKGASKV